LSIPNFYINNEYELVFEFSDTSNFIAINRISSKLNKEQFYIFNDNDGKFENFNEKLYVNSNDLEKTVLININEKIKNKNYYGRYYFKQNDKIISNYFGVSLGNSEFLFNEIKLSKAISIIKDKKLISEFSSAKESLENTVYLIDNNEVIINTYLNDFSAKNNVTGFTEYYFDKKYQNYIEQDDIDSNKFIIKNECLNDSIKIMAITSYNHEIFYSSLTIQTINKNEKNKLDLEFIIDNNIINQLKLKSNEEKIFDINAIAYYFNTKTITKYSDESNLFRINYDKNIIDLDNNRIIVKNIVKDTFTKIVVEFLFNGKTFSKEFPINIKSIIPQRSLDVELSEINFSTDSLNNDYRVYLTDLNTNNKKDVTASDHTEVIFLNDIEETVYNENIITVYNKVEFKKLQKIFNVTNILNNFNLNILFKYTDPDTNEVFECYKSIHGESSIIFQELILNFPNVINIENETKYNYNVYAKFQNDEDQHDITNVCKIKVDECLKTDHGKIWFDSDYACNIINSKQFLITVEYKTDEKIYEKSTTITVKKREIIGIFIECTDIDEETNGLVCARTSSEYVVKLKYADQEELIDISDDPNLTLYLSDTSLAILEDRQITTAILHKPYNIILNAEYKPNNCDNEIYYATKNIHVAAYHLTHTAIIGDIEIWSNKSKDYHTVAYYSNGDIVDHVKADYTILNSEHKFFNDEDYPVNLHFNDETNTLSIHAQKRLNDLDIILSSYYEEKDYEKFEFYGTELNIKILGGFNVKLYGTLLTYDETNDCIKYNVFESPSSIFINDNDKSDDTNIKSFNWNTTEIIKSFNKRTLISPKELISTNNYQIAHIFKNMGNDDWNKIKTININDEFSFDIAEYKIIFDTISNVEDAIFSNASFDINASFDNSYILGLSGLYFEDGFQVMNPTALFETSTGHQFALSFIYDKTNDLWLLNTIPSKAIKLKNISVFYAFTEKEI
jgi:hypothetical protein